MTGPGSRRASRVTAAILGIATLSILAAPAEALICLDSTDCAATDGGALPMQSGPAIGDDPQESWVVGDRLLFLSSTSETGREIWRTDLSQAGTGVVKDINSGPGDGVAGIESAVLGGYLYFVGDDAVNGHELWRTDGTAAGTALFRDTRPGSASGDPRHLTVAGDKVYWQATTDSGRELWVSDGTPSGTGRVIDLGGAVSSTFDAVPVPAGDKVYFLGLSGGVKHLAVTDGTAAGTKLIRAMPSGVSWFTYPRYGDADHRVLAAADRLYFAADDGNGQGRELWTSDGTTQGTVRVLDLSPGSGDSILRAVGWWKGGFYFYNGGPTDQYDVYRASSNSAVKVGWRTSDVTRILGRNADAFYFARSIGLSSAEVVRADATSAMPLEDPGLPVQSIAGGVLHGDTFFASVVVQGSGDKIQAFDAATGELRASSIGTSFTYRRPNVYRKHLVVPASDNAGPWQLVTRMLQGTVVNTVRPSIKGTARVGGTLVARPGTWTRGATLTYQWRRAGVAIPRATRANYRPVPADLGKSLSVVVTGRKSHHFPATAASGGRKVTRGVLKAPKPKISGTVRTGQLLRALPGAWTPGSTLTYRWYADGEVIAGARAKTYRIKAGDRGRRLTVRVTGAKPGYLTVTRASDRTARVR